METYANYYYLNFRSYLGNHGDCYDRFLIRMSEMCESVNITTQVINKLSKFNKVNIKNTSKLGQLSQISNIKEHILGQYVDQHLTDL
jgi:NADH:ubiquinone oxidoreductase subunit D